MPAKRIMIVDDDEKFLEELEEVLTLNGFDTIIVKDSTTVLDIVQSEKPDVILLDLKMDGMTGFQVAKSLKLFPGTANIPIIAMTGVLNKKNHYILMNLCGMKMCLEKPFNPVDLISKIDQIENVYRE